MEPVVIKGVRVMPVADRRMSRPLLVIFLTIFVNLVGFGIIIPLLPFYARTFGASPIVIGLLFASFSLAQLIASPLLGELSDRWGRRPVLILSLIGTAVSFAMLAVAQSLAMLFAARIVDGLSGGNITTARAYIADITDRGEPRQGLRRARRRVRSRLHRRAGARRGVLTDQLHRADLGGGGHHDGGDGARLVVAARDRPSCARRQRVAVAGAAGARAIARAAPAAGDRLHLLDVVRGLPDDVRVVRGAAIRLRRDAHRLSVQCVRRARRDRAGRAGRADRARARQPADAGRSG